MNPIIFDLKLGAVPGVDAFCPDFSKDYKKPETVAAKRAEWLAGDWSSTTAACVVTGIVVPSDNLTVDAVSPATPANLISFIGAITSGAAPVICEHFHVKAAQLLCALFRYGGAAEIGPDLQAEIIRVSKRLYELRRRQVDNIFPFLDAVKFNDGASHVHNPIRALRLDDLSHTGLCAFVGVPNTATRLTIQRKLAHRVGITQE